MKIVITGGAGFLGKRLAKSLLTRGRLTGPEGTQEKITELVLFDIAPDIDIVDDRLRYISGDISDAETVTRLIDEETASIFHLAAVVSAQAEDDFDLGYRINLDGTRHVLEAARALPHAPKLLFTSSVATYGGGLPDVVTDATAQVPQTSYGTAKVMGELLVQDYSRKGYIDGRSLRLPTISVRTGLPNKAASTWASSMIREPLCGRDAICPVSEATPMACMSPAKIIAALIHAQELPAEAFGPTRSLLLPGISITAGEMAVAVERHKGNRQLGKILWQPDPAIQKIVDGWPKATQSARAEKLGFEKDDSLDEMVRAFIEDDLEDQLALYTD
ncbi:NAD-dependent epimerase/dehydratase family protein [Sneathiella chungangensis]|uniref:NAD-dependent epimerase/dehydratase family protein n=1 Tax=Sneathiella chungangensis TaxID=1418234 RepID=A0A845MHE7_9PROT|nr:D-erythronate dehydrogenase [Sneathiella chungangensis]MZR22434.1 NAD-dependent epimerase/dehydratase family protein [Sneathiella chungangensis]